MEDLRKIITRNLKQIIAIKGVRQKDIAEQLGVSQGAISNWLNGSNTPDLATLIKLCRLLDVSLDSIAGTIGPDIPPADVQELIPLLSSLSPEELHLAKEFLELLLKSQRR